MSNKRFFLFITLVLYAVLVLFGVWHHEPWRDEAHPWNAAKEDSLWQIIESVRYSPTPILWTFLLIPFAKLGFPYITMSLLHGSVAIVSMGLLLFISRLPLGLKMLIPFSYYMAYEYAIVSRQYVLTIALLFCIAILYKSQLKKPLLYAVCIALLFQTNIYSFLPAGLLSFLFCIKLIKHKVPRAVSIIAIILVGASALWTFVAYIPHPQGVNQMAPRDALEELPRVGVNAISSSMFSKAIVSVHPIVSSVILMTTVLVFGLLLILIKVNKELMLLAGSSFFWLLYTNLYLHGGTLRHHGLFFVYLLFIMWLSPVYTRSNTLAFILQRTQYVALAMLILISMIGTAYAYSMDYTYSFSGAKDMATYIHKHALLDKDMVFVTAGDTEALLPYIPKKEFWYPEIHSFTRYHINDTRSLGLPWLTPEDIVSSSHKYFFYNPSVLYVLSSPFPEGYGGVTLLHASLTKNFWGNDTEQFWLYARSR